MPRSFKAVFVFPLTSLLTIWCLSASAAMEPIGEVILTDGPFIALQPGQSARSLTRGSEFYQGDRLWTGPRTRAQVRFSDGAIMTLRPDTEFSVDEYEFDQKNAQQNRSLFTLIKGGFRTLTGLIAKLRPDSYQVRTNYAIVGVRGTTYETVIDSGLYVAAWQGTVSVQNQTSGILIGFGQEYNYARVTSSTSAPTGVLATPPQLQQSVDPGLQQAMLDPTETRLTGGLLQNGTDARLTPGEVASLDRFGAATFSGSVLHGAASDGSSGSPLFYDGSNDVVLRQGSAPLVSVKTNNVLAGFPVSMGEWDGSISPALLQPDSTDASVTTPINSPVYWITLFPALSLPTTAAVTYDTVLDFNGAGTGGVVTGLNLNGTLNFGTGALNGNMVVSNADTWNVNFTGAVSGAQFNATADPSSTFNGATGVSGGLSGSLTGAASGFGAHAPLGMGGVFDFASGANDVAGSFLARHDARFFAGEAATLDRPGFATFGGTLLSGTANDGASGTPIIFDQAGNQVLRRLTPAGTDTVVANFAGFKASFGSWDTATSAAVALPDPDGFVQQPVSSALQWITLSPPASLPTGSVAYFADGSAVGGVGSGSGGPSVTVSRFQTDVDFSTGNLSNGRMAVLNGTNTWDALFAGTVSGGNFTASLTAGSNVNGNAAVGGLQGAFTDNASGISGIGGVFDFQQSGLPTTNVQGAFVAREDRRFAAGELATIDRVGMAAFSGPTAPAPIAGEASDGATGSPIIFDVAANQLLRQGAAPLAGAVTTDTTTLGSSFPVSWGAWNAAVGSEATVQGDPNTATPTQLISDPAYWITALPAASIPTTGTATYAVVCSTCFQGNGDRGSVNFVSVNATVNFATAAVSGNLGVQNGIGPTDTWRANFAGSLSKASINAAVDPVTSTYQNGPSPVVTGVTGSIKGTLTGAPMGAVNAPQGMAGAFDLRSPAANHVQGTFLATQ